MQSSPSRRALLNFIGIGILITGTAAGEFIYWRSTRDNGRTNEEDMLPSPYDSRVFEQEMERSVGIFGLLMDKWSRSVAELREPRPMAISVTVVSIVAAGGCFLAASRLPSD